MTPSATGTLASTPLAHALVYARNRRLSGHLELSTDEGQEARITLWRGSITMVQTVPLAMCPGAFFGAVAYELGFIDSSTLDTTLLEIAKTRRLHGEILIEKKAITVAQRDEVLVEQPPAHPYKRARATRLDDLETDVSDGDRAALALAATMFAAEVKKHDPSFSFRIPHGADGGSIADGCAFQLIVDAQVRQAVLEELDPRVRVRMVMDQIALQHGAMLGEAGSKGSVLN